MRPSKDAAIVVLVIGAIIAAIAAHVVISDRAQTRNPEEQDYLGPVVVLIISVLIFIIIYFLHIGKANIQFTFIVMLVFVVIEMFVSGTGLADPMGIGIIIEIVATTMLAMLDN